MAGLLVLAAIVAALVIVILKRRRRRARRQAEAPADQVVGVWDEILDRLAEMRFPLGAVDDAAYVVRRPRTAKQPRPPSGCWCPS